MNRWYFWVLAPIMLGVAIVLPIVSAPPSTTGQVVSYLFSAALVLATLGLADPRRFRWALKSVAAMVLVAGVAYFISELDAWLRGRPLGAGARRPDRSLWNAIAFLLVFGIPALRYLIAGRSGSAVDVIATPDGVERGGFKRRRAPAESSAPRRELRDEVLGVLVWDDDEAAWVAEASSGGTRFRILLAGDDRPDSRLLPHARDLHVSPAALLAQVPPVLRTAAEEIPEAAHEILALHVESVALLWPRRPDDGMVYFDGPGTDERVWRCDYIGRRLQRLGFDD
jgi:hypothetical protein